MKAAVLHHYYALCKNHLPEPPSEDIENYSAALEGSSGIDETYYDVISYINAFPPDSLQFRILSRCFFEEKSDKEIAQELHISRQYVNRIKKKLIAGYLSP